MWAPSPSACLAANGHDVWGVDPDGLKVAAVSAGHSPVLWNQVFNHWWRKASPLALFTQLFGLTKR